MHAITKYLRRHHIGLLALFIALGGTSVAAAGLAKNSVGAKQLKQGAVRSPEVLDRSLLVKDFKRGQLPRGPLGPAGPQGPAGPAGSVGPSQLAQLPAARVRRTTDTQVIPDAGAGGMASAVQVRFDDPTSEQYDIGDMFDPAVPTELKVPVSGTYVITGAVRWFANATGVRNLYLHGPTSMTGQGGIRASSSVQAVPGDTTRQSVATTERLNAGDTVFLSVSQTSGADLALDASQNQIHLSAAFIGP